MSARRPLQPLSPLSANIVGAKYTYMTKVDDGSDGLPIMDERAQDDDNNAQGSGSGSIVSDLTSLENEADEFDRMMIQAARDERRLNARLQGKPVQAFRKARTHPRIGLTMENLENNEAASNGALGSHVQVESPASSSGGSARSARSDPAIQPPSAWGRKGRVRRDWLRTITSDDEQKPGAQEDTIDWLAEGDLTPRRVSGAAGSAHADLPIPSVEDSPLSRKGSLAGTPSSTRRRAAQLDRTQDWDFTMDLNEASMIASTPYLPRNTALDDIRQREIDSLKEQAVTTSRLDKIRESSPEELRRPRSSSARSTNTQIDGATSSEQTAQGVGQSEIRLRKRTNSWRAMGKSPAVTGEAGEPPSKLPILVYQKSSETVGIVDRRLLANGQTSPQRPRHRREDSHDLLRRLARVSSNTPSPGRVTDSRSQTAPAAQPDSSSQTTVTDTSPPSAEDAQSLSESTREPTAADTVATAPEVQPEQDQPTEEPPKSGSVPAPVREQQTPDIDATPMPMEQSMLDAKTPVVTGAWVDTPAPRANRRSTEPFQSPAQSPRKGSPSKRSPKKQPEAFPEEAPDAVPAERIRPALPGSALEAIVEEAKANGQRQHTVDIGDSTINSLEDLIAPNAGAENSETGDLDEDTLQGLQVPTGIPRNEAERQRQQELLHLHRMNERLRATRTSLRDTNRGMKRVENRIEHVEGGTGEEACNPWAAAWTGFKGLFRDPRSNRRYGLTWLSVSLITFLVWYIVENLACEQYCHQLYATSMVGFGVRWNAPRYPFVIPTLFYRTFVRPFWRPFWAFCSWIWSTTYNCCWENDVVSKSATETATRLAKRFAKTMVAQHQETFESDVRIGDDEVI